MIEDLHEHQLTSFINIVIYLLIDFICLFISKAFVMRKQIKISDKNERPSQLWHYFNRPVDLRAST